MYKPWTILVSLAVANDELVKKKPSSSVNDIFFRMET